MAKMDEHKKIAEDNFNNTKKLADEEAKKGNDVSFLHADTNPRYKEILKLDKMLTEAKVVHILVRFLDGWLVVVFTENGQRYLCDAVENYGSYGEAQDTLEITGGLTDVERMDDSVLGYLTAEDVAKRFVFCFEHDDDVYVDGESNGK